MNSLQLAVATPEIDRLYRAIKKLPNAQGLSVRGDTKANIEETFIKTMSVSFGLMIVFAGIIAFGSMLNSSLIEIGDRVRDIATFRVLGYHPRQVAGIFFRQNMIVVFCGILLGVPIGYGLTYAISLAYDTELFRMPVVLTAYAVCLTCVLSFVFVLMAQWFVYRQIRLLDWVEGVKTKE